MNKQESQSIEVQTSQKQRYAKTRTVFGRALSFIFLRILYFSSNSSIKLFPFFQKKIALFSCSNFILIYVLSVLIFGKQKTVEPPLSQTSRNKLQTIVKGNDALANIAAPGDLVDAYQKISAIVGGGPSPMLNTNRIGTSLTNIGDLDVDGTPDLVLRASRDSEGASEDGTLHVPLTMPSPTPPNNSPCNVITNHEFDSGTADWSLFLQSGNTATFTIDNTNQLSGINSAHVDITTTMGSGRDIQLDQEPIAIYNGQEYSVSFSAKASVNRTIGLMIQERQSPWTVYHYETVNLTTTATNYGPFTFTAPSTDQNAGLLFDLGETTGSVYIDNIEFYNEGCNHIISGTLFNDVDQNEIFDVLESGQSGATINLYQDINQDGLYDAGDSYVESATTDVNGVYFFPVYPGPPGNINTKINASTDDAEEEGADGDSPGSIYLASSDIELVQDPNSSQGTQIIGMRFNNITIPQGASINDAYLTFTADTPDGGNPSNNSATTVSINGQDADNALTFSFTTNDITSRSATSATVNWTPTSWISGATYNTPAITNIVQEIIDRAGWLSGNSLAIIVNGTNTGGRVAHSWDGIAADAPVLVIAYSVPAYPEYYITTIDSSTLPATTFMTTDTIETTIFTADGQSDSGNNFGFKFPEICNNSLDDDGDGLADCADSECCCAQAPVISKN